MNISEERLRKLVLRALKELEAEEKPRSGNSQKLYMVCGASWHEGYERFLEEIEALPAYEVCSVVPDSWQRLGYEERLKGFKACVEIVRRSRHGMPSDLEQAVSLFPVVPRDLVVKTALCISDTFETSWIADCMKRGSRIILWRSGLEKFSGREKPAYVTQIMEYYRRVLEYGVEICGFKELYGKKEEEPACFASHAKKTEHAFEPSAASASGRRRVIAASNMEQYASGGALYLQPGDIVTDLAKDRAKFLNIIFK